MLFLYIDGSRGGSTLNNNLEYKYYRKEEKETALLPGPINECTMRILLKETKINKG